MNFQTLLFVTFFGLVFVASTNGLTIRRIDSTSPRPTSPRTISPPTTTVSPNGPVENPLAKGPIVVLQHHGTLDGPSGRFEKTEFQAAPPVDLSLPIVFLPEFIPVHEESQELNMDMAMAASIVQPSFERTQNLASPPIDLSRPVVYLPDATPITEQQQDGSFERRQALFFVRG